jgi:hypothetical protein
MQCIINEALDGTHLVDLIPYLLQVLKLGLYAFVKIHLGPYMSQTTILKPVRKTPIVRVLILADRAVDATNRWFQIPSSLCIPFKTTICNQTISPH